MFFRSKKKPPVTREQFDNPLYSIGEFTYGKPTICSFNDGTRLTIGKFCSISDKVTLLLGGNHRIDWVSTYPFPDLPVQWPEAANIGGHPLSKGDLTIGHDVWIGHGATILSGVTIGSGAVIGACSVVTRDVAPYEIVAGNPAQLIKSRFSPETCAQLLAKAWWNWPVETIKAHIEIICSDRIDKLLQISP
jgi:acetyltransferase-like isoleucine patch superfamily enzyme